MEIFLLIDVSSDTLLGIYDSEEKAKEDISKLPSYIIVNISKPVKLNQLIKEE